jgi:hypothetical protein
MRSYFPREGGILSLWLAGTAIGLFFLVQEDAMLTGLLYLAGSACFLVSVETVKETIRLWRGGQGIKPRLLMPPLIGFAAWSLILSGDAVFVFMLFMTIMAFVAARVVNGKEREWQTRVPFTGAVMMMAELGIFISGSGIGAPLVALVFAVPFTFFSAQELFVQLIAETHRAQAGTRILPSLKDALPRKLVLYSFLLSYAAASAATSFFAPSPVLPALFELFLLSFPVVWVSSGQQVNFRRLGIEQASLDALMTVAVIAFSAAPR